jgi:hypothetical protein
VKVTAIVLCLALGLLISCGSGNDKTKSGMYEPTELALLMKQMLADYGQSKSRLDQKKLIVKRVDYVSDILNAEATDPNDINDLFRALVQPFIEQATKYAQTGDTLSQQIKMHNLTIRSCINCHESFCGGPISAIQNLFVSP